MSQTKSLVFPESLVIYGDFAESNDEQKIIEYFSQFDNFDMTFKTELIYRMFSEEISTILNVWRNRLNFVIPRLENPSRRIEAIKIEHLHPEKYLPQEIPSPFYGEVLGRLILGSNCVVQFINETESLQLYVRSRSLVVIDGESRTSWNHGFPASVLTNGVEARRKITLITFLSYNVEQRSNS